MGDYIHQAVLEKIERDKERIIGWADVGEPKGEES